MAGPVPQYPLARTHRVECGDRAIKRAAARAGYYAYVVKPDSTVETRSLKVGQISEGVAIIDDGVAAGDKVVTAGQYRLQPAARVEVNSPTAKG